MLVPIRFGIDALLEKSSSFKNSRIGLVTNRAATTSLGVFTGTALLEKGFPIRKIFTPEHGFHANGADGVAQKDGTYLNTGIPVISLYGNILKPTEEHLEGLDLIIVDLPDIGCRFYTYLWTMTLVMEACAEYNIPILLTDRPNPTGIDQDRVSGPMLDEAHCTSFIGRWNIPLKHGCTIGELAKYFAGTRIKNLQLALFPVANYSRKEKTAGDFLLEPASPAIKTILAARFYPGTGLLEGIQVNEGRGTAMPFQIFGSPFIVAETLAAHLNNNNQFGIHCHPIRYRPVAGQFAGEICNGVALGISGENNFDPVGFGFYVISTLIQHYKEQVKERLYKTVANPSGKGHLDKLSGVQNCLEKLQKGMPLPVQVPQEWFTGIKNYLLY